MTQTTTTPIAPEAQPPAATGAAAAAAAATARPADSGAGVPAPRPVQFDRDGRKLAGWYHPPARPDGQERDCLVVLCNPIGYDAICTHRHYRQLALRLAADGFAVLRYDHHGTGDSAGSDEDAQRVLAWTRGVSRAVEYGQRLSGAARVALFGVRMGGTLALAAAASDQAAARAADIVAWAPFASGSLYLREMRAMRMMRTVDGSAETLAGEPEADIGEAGGYLLTPSSIEALGGLDLTALLTPDTLAAAPRRILLLARDDLPQSEKLAKHLRRIGCTVETSAVPGYAAMMRDTFDAVVPDEALDTIGTWLAAGHALVPSPVPSQHAANPAPASGPVAPPPFDDGSFLPSPAVRETPVRFGPHGNLFGIVSRPVVPQGERARTAVVFVTTGSNHHIGPNRMYVTQARALAALGFVGLRMDIGGVGESPASPGQRDNHLFARHSIDEVYAGIAWLKTIGVERVVLVGMCSGAYLSFRGAVAEPAVGSVVLINPQGFNWREGDSLETQRRKGIRSLGFYRSRMFDRRTWGRALRGDVDLKVIGFGVASLLRKRLVAALSASAASVRRQPGGGDAGQRSRAAMQDSTDVLGLFRSLLQQGTRVFMLFSANDAGLDEVQTLLGEKASRLRGHAQFRFDVVEGADHTFTPMWAQKRLVDLLVGHVLRTYG